MKMTFLVFFTLIFFGCKEESSPEKVLRQYVSKRFAGGLDRSSLASYLAGPLVQTTAEMSDDELKDFLNLSNLKLSSLKVLSDRCETDKCYLTYIISYETLKDGKTAHKTQVKKAAELIKVEGSWKLFKIDNLKTLHEAKDSIDITN